MRGIRMLILYVLPAVTYISAGAQGTLQFNQVLLLENATGSTSCTSCWTVPAGRVWKIEAVSSNAENFVSLYINNRQLGYMIGRPFANSSGTYGNIRYRETDLPFWMPAGATLGYGGFDNTSRYITFSVIEFNVIP